MPTTSGSPLGGQRSPAGGQHWACTSAIFVASSVTPPRLVRAMSGRSAASATVWPAEPLPGADQAFFGGRKLLAEAFGGVRSR